VTDHADIVREALENIGNEGANLTDFPDALDALDALVAERDARGWSRKEYAALLVRAEAAEAERDEAVTKLARAETELRYTHDRGDHLVYFHEWQEFDKWQRWADDQRKDAEKYQPTAQEFNDAMEGS
jgi:hypothetical protein